ncbi:MAG: phosphatase PAP2 family protein [Tissierellia bacterium]|nr:phosphatase PAP2 family protein [Tissierellia bacterium]
MKENNKKNFIKNQYLILIPAICGMVLGFVTKDGPISIDKWYYDHMFPYFAEGHGHGLMKFLSSLGGAPFIITFMILALIYALKDRNVRNWILLLMATLGSCMDNTLLKWVFQRERPVKYMMVYEGSASFPSGHSMISLTLYLTVALILSELYPERSALFRKIFLLLVFCISLSRIALGVHWPTDIIGGWLFGLAAYHIHLGIRNLWEKDNSKNIGTIA